MDGDAAEVERMRRRLFGGVDGTSWIADVGWSMRVEKVSSQLPQNAIKSHDVPRDCPPALSPYGPLQLRPRFASSQEDPAS